MNLLYPNRFTAVLDACVLGGALRRNMLLSLAEAGLFRPRWSNRILCETQKAIMRITNGESDGIAQRSAMEMAFPEAFVTGFEKFEDKLNLPDHNDNHVLAAAIATSAAIIVTENIHDFPAGDLQPHSVETRSADDAISDIIDIDPPVAVAALKRMRQRLNRPEMDVQALIFRAEAQGLTQVADSLVKHQALL